MIGVDIIEIKRVKDSLKRLGKKWKEKLFTASEIAYCDAQKKPAQHYAARFAAKEAVAKLIKEGPRSYWQDIEITKEKSGAPKINLSPRLKKLFPHPIHISLTHSENYAVAVAMVYSLP